MNASYLKNTKHARSTFKILLPYSMIHQINTLSNKPQANNWWLIFKTNTSPNSSIFLIENYTYTNIL